ncbi:hypothetical protein [Devosia sp. DBB001]|nr:hypothetical protein [Devosia sp. DBB001]
MKFLLNASRPWQRAGMRALPMNANVSRYLVSLFPFVVFLAIAAIWTSLTLSGAPQIVPTADGGNVASIVAAQLYPDRFVDDPVFSNPQNFHFYQTLMIPAVAVLTRVTGDIGTAFMLMGLPLLFVQMVGFYLLGRTLFGGRLWPLVLAVTSVPPVYVFAGELWGMLSSPLTRSAFAAIFPFLMLAALRIRKSWHIAGVMLLCGVSIYIHPVSAPSVALGILAMMTVAKPLEVGWPEHLAWAVVGGLLFVACAIPFALGFVGTFAQSQSGEVARVLTETLRANVGGQYYSAVLAVEQFVVTVFLSAPVWILLVWVAALSAPFVLLARFHEKRVLLLLAFGVGLAIGSVGVSLLDQGVALLRGSHPIQIDLIRNIRFFVPLLLILLVWMLARWSELPSIRRASLLLGSLLACVWWLAYPNPIVGQNALSRPVVSVAEKQLLQHLAVLPAGSRVLPLPHLSSSEDVSLLALAVRYEALQPTAFLYKDMNFLSYSGSDSIAQWYGTAEALRALEDAPTAGALSDIARETSAAYLLVHSSASEAMKAAAERVGKAASTFGEWTLLTVD